MTKAREITKQDLLDENGIGRYITIINRLKANDISKFKPSTVVHGEYADQTRKVKVTSVEDRGEFFYVGYRPVRFDARWGYTRIYKDISSRKYGTIDIIPGI
jgi:hypothetical protein